MNCGSGGGFGNRNPSVAICSEITDVNTAWVLIFINFMLLLEFDLLISFSPSRVIIYNSVKILKNIEKSLMATKDSYITCLIHNTAQ